MRTFSFVFVIPLIYMFSGSVTWASGGGEGAEAPKAVEAAGQTGSKEDREFREKSAKLAGLEVKILEMDKGIAELIEKKRRSKDPETRAIMNELVTLSDQRNKSVKEHRQLRDYLLYRFPNLGETVTNRYGVHVEMSVDQHEKSSGLDLMLTELKEVIQQKYRPMLKDDSKKVEQEEPSSPASSKEKPLRLVK